MTVRFLIGRSKTGKTTFCLNEIQEKMMQEPDGEPLIYLVPDQMTFLSEYKLISTPNLGGMIRTQVYSFSRLAWRILQETGGISRLHINNVGISMLIRKIIEDKKDKLKLFERAANKNGFVEQMEQILTEFKRYCIRSEEMLEKQQSLTNHEANNKILQDKLHDLELIYQAFEEATREKHLDSEDYLRLLAEKVAASPYLQKAHVYIDGFYRFTPQEYMIVEQLMKHCQTVTITFTLDRPFYEETPDDLHLFRMSGEHCQTIYEIARAAGIKREEIIFEKQQGFRHESLQHLERVFESRPASRFEGETRLQLSQAANRRAEIEGIARRIRKLVRTEHYRYREMAILMRNGQEYQDILESVFHEFDLPLFIDQKRTMLHHPLIEFIRSTLEIINSYWRYESVFRAVKTEFLFPLKANRANMRERMDVLENYVLAYGIQGARWTSKEPWYYRRFSGLESTITTVQTDAEKALEDELNELRTMITRPLLKLSGRLNKAQNVTGLCEAVYLYLEELDIPTKLEEWKLGAEEQGNLTEAREHDQAWNAIIELLDQYVEMLGEEQISTKQFAKIFDAGLESLRFSLVPPAIDQVLVADLEKSRLSDVKVAFIIGMNEGVLPAKFSEDGLLADDERESLLGLGLKIAPSGRARLLDEEFLAYKAFTTPTEALFVSYPLANEEGKALMPSPYIKRLYDLFPQIGEHHYLVDPSERPELEQLEFVAHEETSLSYLTAELQQKKRNYPIFDFWWDVYNYYICAPKWREKAQTVLSSLTYENRAKTLSAETSKQLYGEDMQASVSRMELFSACPFSHFANYGLKLRERRVFRLEAPDIGELFHGALNFIAETIVANKRSWSEVTNSEMEQLAQEAVELLAPKLQHEILLSSNRHYYIKRKLEQIIKRASLILKEHAKASGFAPVGLEIPFGREKKLPSLKFSLNNGTSMELIGRIDRVDKAEDAHGAYLRIIDYKSSAQELNLTEVYYGLALQMLTYLDIIIENSKLLIGTEASPAGVLYFHVHDPIINTKKLLSFDEIEAELFKKFKMSGLVLGDDAIVKLMDQTLESGESNIISAGINKDGTLSKRSKVASKDDFHYLRQHVRNTYVKIGNEITDGAVQITPYKMKDRSPCTFCSYKSVCQFDESMTANEYRKLPVLSKEQVLELIRKEAGTDGENDYSTEA